jgi:hypothetical protein
MNGVTIVMEDRVHFYEKNDYAAAYELELAEKKLKTFSHMGISDINTAIEYYNIKQYFDNGLFLPSWDDNIKQYYIDNCSDAFKKSAIFFSEINENNINEILTEVDFEYLENFWELFAILGVYKRISAVVFERLIVNTNFHFRQVLRIDVLVKEYDAVLASGMRADCKTAELLIDYYLVDHSSAHNDRTLHFPKTLSNQDKEQLLTEYASSEDASVNYLFVISISQSSNELKISDKLKLLCKKRHTEFWENNKDATFFEMGLKTIFRQHDGPYKRTNYENHVFTVEYNTKYLEMSSEREDLFAAFAWFFGFVDKQYRSQFVSKLSEMGILERTLGTHGIKEYRFGAAFRQKNLLYSVVTQYYQGFLEAHGTSIEDVLCWFFNEYLTKEFGAEGFLFSKPSAGTSYLEKCKLLPSALDGILKQFILYQEEGTIDRDLYEISSGHIVIDTIPSLVKPKYAYAKSDEINKRMHMLFSDQSTLYYVERTKDKYKNLYELLTHEKTALDDYYPWQKTGIDWLVSKGDIIVDDAGVLLPNKVACYILHQLFHEEVICVQREKAIRTVLDELEKAGDLEYKSTLFSKPEADYLNYMLNKSEFSNGLDLRNRYIHDTNTLKEEEQRADYYTLLRLLVLVALKIQDEFCIKEELT